MPGGEKKLFLGSNLRDQTSRILAQKGATKESLTEVMRRVGFEVAFNANWNLPDLKKEQRASLSQALLGLTDFKPSAERGDDLESYNFLMSVLIKAVATLD